MSSKSVSKPAVNVQIRWMIRRDMAEVIQIEQASFEYHWTEADFLHCLRQRNCIGMVAEQGSRVVGFMIYELFKNRLHVLNFAVAADVRHTGVGNQMVEKLVTKLSQQRRDFITLEVRETNLDAQLFFRRQGFKAVQVLRDHYQDTSEDAYLMQFALHSAEEKSRMYNPANRIADYEEA
ncbi:MAG: ribosomal-protein-alanine N-acetyltransferase [Planctomycetaceae bacterium]|nr:ribosomal-protein-alanine N-acetyltransferase [Planctomycetaceae bacterium]